MVAFSSNLLLLSKFLSGFFSEKRTFLFYLFFVWYIIMYIWILYIIYFPLETYFINTWWRLTSAEWAFMWVRRKGYSFVLIFIHRTFLFPYSAFLSSCLWSIACLGLGPTELIQAWGVCEINGSSAGEKEKLRNGISVILASAPCGICQNFLNRDPNALLWILWVP